MGTVYRRSKGNLIHLTDDEKVGRQMVDVIESIYEDVLRETDDCRKFSNTAFHKDGSWRNRAKGMSDEHLGILIGLVQLPWFRSVLNL